MKFHRQLLALVFALAALPAIVAAQPSKPADAATEPSVFDTHLETIVRLLEGFEARVAHLPAEIRQRDLSDLRQHLIAVYGHAVRAEEPVTVRERLRELIGVVERAIDGDAIGADDLAVHHPAPDEKAFTPGTGTILGEVTRDSDGSPIYYAHAKLWDSTGTLIDSTDTSYDGLFAFSDLAPGQYYVSASDYGLVTELYDDVECPDELPMECGSPADLIDVVADDVTPIGVSLGRGSTVSATVRDADSDAVLYADFWLYDADGDFVDSGYPYTSPAVGGLAAGTYFAVAGSDGYRNQLYSAIDCPDSCDVTAGTPIVLGRNADHGPIEFSLSPLGKIAGQVTDSAGVPIPFAEVRAVGTGATTGGWSDSADAQGVYTIEGLDTGGYIVRAGSRYSHMAEVYEEQPCSTTYHYECDLSTATIVMVTLGETTGGIDFSLEPLGHIKGSVVGAGFDGPWGYGSSVRFYRGDDPSYLQSSTAIESSGSFLSDPLPPGSYWITAEADGFVRQVYDGVDCHHDLELSECLNATATKVAVELGETTDGIDFELQRASAISGRVYDANTGFGLGTLASYDRVRLTKEDASWRFANPGDHGTYYFGDLGIGTYYVSVEESQGFQREIYDDIPCPDEACDPFIGTPIVISQHGSLVDGIDFALDRLPHLSGTVRDAVSGLPIVGARIHVQEESPGYFSEYVASSFTDGAGKFLVRTPAPGKYRLWILPSSVAGTHVPLAYDGQPCALLESGWNCYGRGDLVTVAGGQPNLTDLDFDLLPVGYLFTDGFESGDVTSWSATAGD